MKKERKKRTAPFTSTPFRGRRFFLGGLLLLLAAACQGNQTPKTDPSSDLLLIDSVFINGQQVANGAMITNLPLAPLTVRIVFTEAVNTALIDKNAVYFSAGLGENYTCASDNANPRAALLTTTVPPASGTQYTFSIQEGKYFGGSVNASFRCTLVAAYGGDPVFPVISNDSLLTLVQRQTFRYFWDFGHPVSGMARDRTTSGNTVTTSGTGFGIMAMLAAVERAFISRTEALSRIQQIVTFLATRCTTYHGAFSHWINGETGATQPFSPDDNGGDLVETAHLMHGLLAAQEYFKTGTSPQETTLCSDIQILWENVEWDWYRQNGQNVLYWHWSPDKGWKMNMRITGWDECLIVYVLAASSPTHPIDKAVYDEGWARNGAIRNGRKYYDITLPLGSDMGGPLFFSHYSFLGLDPRNLRDQYAGYWEQATAHSRINHAYCVANPKRYAGYGASCWGLTASDIPNGYTASSPTNDVGTIAPTAALSSFPYTPDESMAALHFFYYTLGQKLWAQHGFKDAFNLSKNWFAADHLAIDQGPIVVMIENYRTGLLWNLFMRHPDVQRGLERLGFER
jgi:hypothetical protein